MGQHVFFLFFTIKISIGEKIKFKYKILQFLFIENYLGIRDF